ncbi:MAG: nucleoside triphosphate pyrophosphohydrolase [Ferruginibacter sp.]|nr:nucleoside triphosphate pyrophosphohydrolase [Ferruginibacter sp.]
MSVENEFNRLVKIMDELREKCPWDRKQTIESLRQLTIEETYELADAITEGDFHGLKEELGDLMLHLVFYSKIATEKNLFTLEDVLGNICEKLIRRHPHIYGEVKVENEEDVKQNWEKIKLAEGKKSVLSGVPRSLPAMVKAMRLQEKAKQVGFEWDHTSQVWDKVTEELKELELAMAENNSNQIEEEFGDVLFSLVNLSRFLSVDAENALERTNKKFLKRFTLMEETAKASNRHLHEMTLEEMDAMWNEIKKNVH